MGFSKKAKVQKCKSALEADNTSKSSGKELVETEYVTASKVSDPETGSFVLDKSKIVLMDTCGDVITFKSGDKVTARVTEITDDKIKYKRCDNLDGPIFVVNKGTVQTIRYANGVVENIEAPQPAYHPNPNVQKGNDQTAFKKPKVVHPKATVALLSLLLLWWLFGLGIVLGAIFSYLAIKEIDMNPDKYKGRQLAKVVNWICMAIITFFIRVLILILVIY
ncbi:MAG: hypothetical protein IPG08_07195 [Sphingobacteriaceae bacterium]|nr:hypothetical protein [Sphingobacteriaceae bacterium]